MIAWTFGWAELDNIPLVVPSAVGDSIPVAGNAFGCGQDANGHVLDGVPRVHEFRSMAFGSYEFYFIFFVFHLFRFYDLFVWFCWSIDTSVLLGLKPVLVECCTLSKVWTICTFVASKSPWPGECNQRECWVVTLET